MSSVTNQQHEPEFIPTSPSAGGQEMHNDYGLHKIPQPLPQDPYLTPYLGLRARLSQTWINRWTILLLLVLVRTLFAVASLENDLTHAKADALSACTSVENVGSAMASMPYYLSTGVNELTANGIEKAINGLMEMLMLTITGVEDIVLFIINLMTSTYVCLITLAVGGSLHVAIDVAADVGNALNSTIQGIGSDLGGAVTDFQNAMDGFLKDLEELGSIFSGHVSQAPTINLTSEITALNSIQLPSNYYQGLNTLNDSIPTFAQVHNFTNSLIELPFQEVLTLLNESLPKYNMNASLFPVPAKQYLTFCSNNNGITDFFDDLIKIAYLAAKIFLVVLIIGAVLAMLPMAYRDLRGWRAMKKRAVVITSDAYDPMDAVYIASRPYTAWAGLKLTEKVKSSRRRALIRWAVAYATTIPALFVLSLALAGLLGCLCQYILLKAVEKEVPVLENEVIGFADMVINSLNNASEQWAIGTNGIINDTNTQINADVFGWVNTTTTAVNNTLNEFVDQMMNTLNETFGGTVLYEPILGVLNCLVLLKVQGIEDGLTWVSDHAYVDFPMIPNNTFSLDTIAKVSGSNASILNTGPTGGAADAITAALDDVITFAIKTIRQEAIIAFCLFLIWCFIALIGIIRAFVLIYKGGDGDVYVPGFKAPEPGPPADGPTSEKHGLASFFKPSASKIPGYGQTSQRSHFEPDGHRGNTYNGQTYTLTPQPVPDLDARPSDDAPVLYTGSGAPGGWPNENFGSVKGKIVDSAIRDPNTLRTSSYANFGVTSPIVYAKHDDPFADPRI